MTTLEIRAFQALKGHFSNDEAETIVEYIESKKGISEDRAKSMFITEDRLTTIFTTKKEVADLRSDIKTDIANLRAELKTDNANLRTELKTEINGLRTELKAEIGGLRTDIEKGFREQMKWIIGMMIGIASLTIAIIKLL